MMKTSNDALHLYLISALAILGGVILFTGLKPGVPDFSRYEAGPERKRAFFSYFLPIVKQKNQEILNTRKQLLGWNEQREDLGWWASWQVENLAEEYDIEDFDIHSEDDWTTLLRRVDIVPPSLALAQAANESAWGTSRFARNGYNYYGEWCFVKGCGIVPDKRGEGKYHEVADFDAPQDSVNSYIHNLNYHWAYKSLRELREKLRESNVPITGIALTNGLHSYSTRGEDYVRELQSMIVFNNLSQYDES